MPVDAYDADDKESDTGPLEGSTDGSGSDDTSIGRRRVVRFADEEHVVTGLFLPT